ncbi:hypothetical protein CC78DRAFT_582565 [Lojkania enalia]|uniref:Uncharacterized protein n=1 Tax=Lojkania enalia TaxID=147567 RepID=A0A9P4K9E3_9PLEO|nr:hypothetical protein CC78DRAFT_582565 [Didymosphaeria enalia]
MSSQNILDKMEGLRQVCVAYQAASIDEANIDVLKEENSSEDDTELFDLLPEYVEGFEVNVEPQSSNNDKDIGEDEDHEEDEVKDGEEDKNGEWHGL